MLSQVSSLRLSSGYSGLGLTLSSPCVSLFSPCLLVADVSIWATSLLGVVVRRCNLWVLFIYFFLPVMLPFEIPKLSIDLMVRGSPGIWKLLLLHDSLPGQVSIPNSFASLFMFYILSYLLSKTMGYLSGCLVSSASIQKLFCSAFKFAQHSNDLLMNLRGRKWSPRPIPPLPS